MAVTARIELEVDEAWVPLTAWVIAFDSWSGRSSGLGPHRAGDSTLLLRVPQGTTNFPASLGSGGRAAIAQGDRIRVYIRPGTATERLIWVGWIKTVKWQAQEVQHYCTVESTDALGRLGPVEITYPQEPQEITRARLEAILNAAGWDYGATLDLGTIEMADTRSLAARTGSAAEFAQAVALSDPGTLCARPSLTAPLRFLEHAYTPARVLVISDQAATSGVRWQHRPVAEAAEDHLVNVVAWTTPGQTTRQSRRNSTSVDAYGERRLDRDYESNVSGASTVAGEVLRTYAEPVTLPRTATVAAHLEPDDRASAAAATVIGDQVDTVVTGFDGTPVTTQTLADGVGWRLRPLYGQGIAADLTLRLIPPADAAVRRPPSLGSLPDLTAPAGHPWQTYLPTADGGTGDGFGYTVTGRPSWLSFDADRRLLSGTAPFTGGPWTLTYVAVDLGDATASATATFDVAARILPVALPAQPNVTVATGQAVDLLLPEASGGSGTFTYTAADAPSWATLTGRRLRGTAPTTAKAAVTITYTATDDVTGATAGTTFDLTVAVNPVTLATVSNRTAAAGSRVTLSLPAAAGGSGDGFTYQLRGRPSWLTVTGRTAAGTAPYQRSTYHLDLTWRATDTASGQTADSAFRLTVTVQPVALAAQSDVTVTAGTDLDLLLPEASGGSGTFTYTAADAPSWATLTGRRLRGTAPTTAKAAVTITYTATDDVTGATAGTTFDLTVAVNPVTLATVSNRTAAAGSRVTLSLPAAAGGSGDGFTYQLRGRPSWLTVTGRTAAGTAPYQRSTYHLDLTWRATDTASGQTADSAFRLTVTVQPVALAAQSDVTVTAGTDLDLLLPEASGGSGTFTYTAADAPSWATLTGRRLRGTAPTTAKAAVTITYTATDDVTGATAGTTFDLTVAVNPVTLATVSNRTAAAGSRVTLSLPAAAGGSGDGFTYQLRGRPSWLTVTGRTAAGTAPYQRSTYHLDLTWRATDTASGQTADSAFRLTVTVQPVALAAQSDVTVTAGTDLDLLLPEASGGSGTFTYTAADAPSWATLTGRRLRGTAPTTAKAAVTITYTATDDVTGATAGTTFDLTVAVNPVTLATVSNRTAAAGSRVTLSLPAAAGGSGDGFTYQLRGRPSWLTVTGRTAAGTAPYQRSTYHLDLTWRATDTASGQTADSAFRLTVTVQPVALAAQSDVTVTAGTDLDLLLPEASGGSGTFTYTAADAPSWATLTGRRLRGTAPTTAKAAVTITYTATDDVTGATAGTTFDLTVAVNPVTLATVSNRTAAAGSRVTLSLPAAAGGSGDGFTYQLRGRPSWLTVTGRTAAGTAPYQRSTYHLDLTWRATDTASGQTADSAFRLTVTVQPVALAAQSDVTVTAGTDLDLLLPEASGGSGTFTYTAADAPSWATLTGRRLRGTAPTTAKAAVTITYTATDDVTGATANTTFDLTVAAAPPSPPEWTTTPSGSGTHTGSLDYYVAGRVVGSYPIYRWPSAEWSGDGGYTRWEVEIRGIWSTSTLNGGTYVFDESATRPRAAWRRASGTIWATWPQHWAYPARLGDRQNRYSEIRVRGVAADGTRGPWSKVLTFLGSRPCQVTERDDWTLSG